MFRPCFSAFLLTTTCCGLCLSAPNWKAPGLVKSLREADRVVERAQLPPEAFNEPQIIGHVPPGTPPSPALQRKYEVLDGLTHSALCAEPHVTAVAVTAVTDNPDGSAFMVGTWNRDTKGRVFYTASELEQIANWDRRWAENQAHYKDRVTTYNRATGKRDPLSDPAHNRDLHVRQFNAERDQQLRPAHEAARERENRYANVRVELIVQPALATKIDRPKLLRARQVSLLVHPRQCDLILPDAAISVPPVIALIQGDLVDIDPAWIKKETGEKTAEP